MRVRFEELVTDPHHHAYIIFGAVAEDVCGNDDDQLCSFCSEKSMGVDEVRLLGECALQSVHGGARKVVIRVPGITDQAQHALLKIIEDMRQRVYFFLCVPAGTTILATLQSRCHLVDLEDSVQKPSSFFQTLLAASVKDRLAMLDALWDEGEGVRHVKITGLLQDVEAYGHQLLQEGQYDASVRVRKALVHLRDGVQGSALHKATVQAVAFI